jgi:hypothetical protein
MKARTLVISLAVLPLLGHDPITTKLTFTQEITRILNKRCVSCHTEFKTYAAARPWAKAIRDEVATRRMPPWGPAKGIGDFLGDRSLTSPEIDMLIAWVEGGAPEGDPIYLPTRIPPTEPLPSLPRYARALVVDRELKLDRAANVVALEPKGSLEAWAIEPSGAIVRLIRLPVWRPGVKGAPKNFVCRDPVTLPAGSRIRVEGPASLTLYLR